MSFGGSPGGYGAEASNRRGDSGTTAPVGPPLRVMCPSLSSALSSATRRRVQMRALALVLCLFAVFGRSLPGGWGHCDVQWAGCPSSSACGRAHAASDLLGSKGVRVGSELRNLSKPGGFFWKWWLQALMACGGACLVVWVLWWKMAFWKLARACLETARAILHVIARCMSICPLRVHLGREMYEAV